MKVMELITKTGTSRILSGAPLAHLGELCKGRDTAIITDENVFALFGSQFPPARYTSVVAPGENAKTIEQVSAIHEELLKHEFDREAMIIGIGGGVVTDLAGFVAATFLRGIDFGFAATTLLAQVDAAVGGKNGVNLNRYKNVVGTFRQPSFVLCDYTTLSSLNKAELRMGLSETVKAAAIKDAALFELLEEKAEDILALKSPVTEDAISAAVKVKVDVVAKDELESGNRRLLNFGHTLGHAYERAIEIGHGDAVAAGMVAAASVSVAKGLLKEQDEKRIVTLLERLSLPTRLEADPEALIDAVRRDKKRRGDKLAFVLLEGIGKGVVLDIDYNMLEEVIRDLC